MQESKLDCICALCDHDCMDKKCLYNKIMASMNPEQKQKELFLALLKEVCKKNTTGNSRVKIKPKKG